MLGTTELVFHCVGHEKAAMENSKIVSLRWRSCLFMREENPTTDGVTAYLLRKSVENISPVGPVHTCDLQMGSHGRLLLAGSVFVGQAN